MKKIIIFLDIDGVIATKDALDKAWTEYMGEEWSNTYSEKLHKYKLSHPGLSMSLWPFDRNCCRNIHLLQRIFEDYKVVYVISSSWRTGRTIEELDELFKLKGLYLNSIIGKTGRNETRGKEILQWLKENNEENTPFIVLDDECTYDIDCDISYDYLIDTPFKSGFNDEKFNEAIDKIKKQL